MHELMNNTYFSLALIIVGFGFLIFVHELGHFLVAKMVGIKTTQFAIGFGQALLCWRKGIGFRIGTTEPEYEQKLKEGVDPSTLGETEYRLNYIPLGGYVKMLGQEDLDPSAQSDDPRAFNNKSVGARFAVISAGVIMNVIFGMIFFVIAFMSGVKFPPAIVGAVAPNSPAATTYAQGHENDPAYLGLQLDDRITHLNGKPVDDMMDVKYATILAVEGTPITLTVQRAGIEEPLIYPILPRMNADVGFFEIGIDSPLDLKITDIIPDSPADHAGVKPGMRITAVNGQPVNSFSQYQRLLAQAMGRTVTVSITDPKSQKKIDLTTAAVPTLQNDNGTHHLLGLIPPTRISFVAPGKPADKAGVRTGDLIEAVGGIAWPSLTDFQQAVKDAAGQAIDLTVFRDGQSIKLGPIKPSNQRIGVGIENALDTNIVAQVLDNAPWKAAGTVPPGSRFMTLNGNALKNWADLQRELSRLAAQGTPFTAELVCQLNLSGEPHETMIAEVDETEVRELAKADWLPALPEGIGVDLLRLPVVGDNPIDALALGFKKTHQWITNTYMTLLRLTQGTVPADKLSGPVGIVHQGTIIARGGWQYLLFFLGLISINLAVLNFLPIPITDGGQAVFLMIEKIKGSPVSVRVQTAATILGLALLGCVFLFVTYNDILRLVQN